MKDNSPNLTSETHLGKGKVIQREEENKNLFFPCQMETHQDMLQIFIAVCVCVFVCVLTRAYV